ncbi:hypothetical protein Tco_0144360 [Tanacetum coccineum]
MVTQIHESCTGSIGLQASIAYGRTKVDEEEEGGNKPLSKNVTPIVARINDLERQMFDEKLVLVDDNGKPLKTKVNKSTSIPSTSKKVVDESESDIEDIYDETAQYMASGDANDPSLLEDEDYDTYDTYDLDVLTESQMAFVKAFDINLRGQIR